MEGNHASLNPKPIRSSSDTNKAAKNSFQQRPLALVQPVSKTFLPTPWIRLQSLNPKVKFLYIDSTFSLQQLQRSTLASIAASM